MLGEPALVARHHRGDAQREALLAEQRVAAVARAVRPDLAGLGEVDDVLRVAARPRDVRRAVDERGAHRVQRRHEVAVLADQLERRPAHPGHDAHVDDDVRRVGDLDTELGDPRAQRAHRERHHVHRATAHRAGEQALEGVAHLHRVGPVVGGPRVLLVQRADEGPVLDPRDVGRVGAGKERVRALGVVQAYERAALDEQRGEPVPLLLRAVAPLDPVGLGQVGYLLHPLEQLLVARRWVVQTWGHRHTTVPRSSSRRSRRMIDRMPQTRPPRPPDGGCQWLHSPSPSRCHNRLIIRCVRQTDTPRAARHQASTSAS